ncbi:MAG: class I SAM-dependent methyltransferase [Acidobacteriota bacterium]
MTLKSLYHAAVPKAVRYPIGRLRRGAIDSWRRACADGPELPPRPLLQRVQMTPWVGEYLRVGRASAAAISSLLTEAGTPPGAQVLDFGCGLARTLRFIAQHPQLSWRMTGCDVDRISIEWCRGALPSVEFHATWLSPPLPFPRARFDAVYAVSVFTHFAADEQRAWAQELARVVRPGGFAAITTMGPLAFGSFHELQTADRLADLDDGGFVYDRGGEAFNQRGAFHTPRALADFFEPYGWALRRSLEGGIDGFQDLHLLERLEAGG